MDMEDDQAPATKADVKYFINMFTSFIQEMFDRFDALDEKIRKDIAASEHRTHILMEDLRHDVMGIHKDKIQQHEDRILRLETHTGLRSRR